MYNLKKTSSRCYLWNIEQIISFHPLLKILRENIEGDPYLQWCQDNSMYKLRYTKSSNQVRQVMDSY